MCINYKVPFYSNTPDDTHCFQASLRMVLKYFEPEKEFTWEELEKITAKVDGLWTWATAGVLWMQENGYDVKNIESFDYEKFIKERELYLLEIFGNEMGKAQIEHSDVDQECKLAKRYIKEVDLENRIPCVDDIDNLLNDGYLIICNVNSVALNNEKGYAGHSVVIKGIFEDKIILHDPGLPALENRVVTFEQFEKAWAYPDEKSKNITAFKLKNNMQENAPKTFEEIDAKLQEDLKNISKDIEEIENHMQAGQELLEKQVAENAAPEVIEKYKKGLDELQKGLEMFLGIKEQIQTTIVKLHDTKAQADEYIKSH